MDNYSESKIPIESQILLNSMKDISNYFDSVNEQSQYYAFFNEALFQNNNKWLDDIKIQIKNILSDSNPNSNPRIIITDINYDNKIKSLIRKIAQPQNHKKYNQKKENQKDNFFEEKNEFLEKVDELTNFSDIMEAVNSCSKKKRTSYLSTIHKKSHDNNTNFNSNEKNEKESENIYDLLNDEDLNMINYNSSNEKEKIINNNEYPSNLNEDEENENSLCTIVEQPSNEELDKNGSSQRQINFLNSKQLSFSNQMNKQSNKLVNSQSNENNNKEYTLVLNKNINNESNNQIKDYLPHTDNKKPHKPLIILESIITPQKSQDYLSNSHNINILDNLFNSQQKTPDFIKNNINIKSSNKEPIPINSSNIKIEQQLSFNKTNKKIINHDNNIINNEFTFSSIKKNDTKNNTPIDKNYINSQIVIKTFKKNKESNDYNNHNNQNFINILTNTINNVNEQSTQKNKYNNIQIQSNNNSNNNINFNYNFSNNKNNINIQNNFNNNGSSQKQIVQNLVLTSTKKPNIINKNNINTYDKILNKYENDFEEYEMSDLSLEEGEEEEKMDKEKFVPKWAEDEEYLDYLIERQNKDDNLRIKSFGNFVAENLNLNMIFETHNQAYEVRNSTADWRGDNSFEKDKVTDVNDKEINNIFPNRKLNF